MEQLKESYDGIGMTSRRSRERLIDELRGQGIKNEEVLAAMRDTPRHIFVDSAVNHRAYENVALPIGWEQTISQPLTVADMTMIAVDALDRLLLGKRNKVLEIGSGCGYQAAILARLFKQVYGVERIKPLYEKGRRNLNLAGVENVTLCYEDGRRGWEQQAPFDAIIISAATAAVPDELLMQLGSPACLVAPVGGSDGQTLTLVTSANNEMKKYRFDEVIFVPLLQGVKDSGSE